MYLYKKKSESHHHPYSNSGAITVNKFPIDLLSKTNNQFIKYSYLKPNNSSKSNNISHKRKSSSKSKNECNSLNNTANIKQPKSVNTNNYIINTLIVSEKNLLHNNVSSAKQQKSKNQKINDFDDEINKIIKEKEELENTVQKQEKLIQKLLEENKNLDEKINNIEIENKKINKKISLNKENQEQLIMLVKIVQRSGVDVKKIIDKWNDEVDNENNKNIISTEKNISSISDSINESNSKIGPASFIPINIDEPHINKKVFNGIPKLNFDIIKNGRENIKNKREKFINNSK